MKEFAVVVFLALIGLGFFWQVEVNVTRNIPSACVIDEEAVAHNCRVVSGFPGVCVTYSVDKGFLGAGGSVTYHIRCPWWLSGKIASSLM